MRINSKRIAAFFLLSVFSPFISRAQSITIQPSSKIMDDYLHDFFQPVPGRYVAINYADRHGAFTGNRTNIAVITGYDAKMNTVYSGNINALSGKEYEGGIEIANHLYIFYADATTLSVDELDATNGQLKGNPSSLFGIDNKPTDIFTGFSADSSYCYALFKCAAYKCKDEMFQGVVMDKNMKVITKFSFPLAEVKSYIDRTICTLSPRGQFFVMNAVRIKSEKGDYRPLQYFVTAIDKDGSAKTSYAAGLPGGKLDNLYCTAAANGFNITGLLAKGEKEGFTTIFTGQYDDEQKKVINQKQNVLSNEPYWKKLPGSRWREGKPDGIPPTVKLVYEFKNADESTTLLLQQKEEIHTYNGNFNYTDYFEGSIFVVNIKKNSELGWIQLLPFYTQETPQAIYAGFIAFQKDKKDLYILYHDIEKNTRIKEDDMPALVAFDKSRVRSTILVTIAVKPGGAKTSTIIDGKEDEDFHIAPHQRLANYNNEVLCTFYQYKNLGRSNYKAGLIQVR